MQNRRRSLSFQTRSDYVRISIQKYLFSSCGRQSPKKVQENNCLAAIIAGFKVTLSR